MVHFCPICRRKYKCNLVKASTVIPELQGLTAYLGGFQCRTPYEWECPECAVTIERKAHGVEDYPVIPWFAYV